MASTRILRIGTNDNLRKFEEYLRKASIHDFDIFVPIHFKFAGRLGRSLSLAQLVATRAQRESKFSIYTKLDVEDEISHERFVRRLHGLAAVYFSDSVFANDNKTDIRRVLLEAAANRIRAMKLRNYRETSAGRQIELVFVNHAKQEFHDTLYKKAPKFEDIMDKERHGKCIASAFDLNGFLHKAIRSLQLTSNDYNRIRHLLDDTNMPLGSLLHESFQNTAEHAYLDSIGQIPNKGLRCVSIAVHQMEQQELQPKAMVSSRENRLDRYFKTLRQRSSLSGRKKVVILEISIFDSGPGFAATIHKGQNISDKDLVTSCFQYHSSSKSGPNSGFGLNRIIEDVNRLKGFARFRTSTTEAIYCHSTESSLENNSLPTISDNFAKVVGTTITIGIPLTIWG